VKLFQDVRIFAARLEAGREARAALLPGRAGFLQVASGSVSLNGLAMHAGDGARIEGVPSVSVVSGAPSEILFFDLA
jgi:redox-sensitive bicupin YhaK (pirin superfamily)